MSFRRNWLTRPIFSSARRALPTMSDTEREALEAGDVWWDAELFTGNPDWSKLLDMPAATLSAEEQAFLQGPVEQLCGLLDDWRINWELRDLPPEVWDFIKANRFFWNDHTKGVRWVRILGVRTFGGDQKNFNALRCNGGHGHGSQFARTW